MDNGSWFMHIDAVQIDSSLITHHSRLTFHHSPLTIHHHDMIYRSKAPLRIGLAGGGTDVSPYTERFGGAILNATINLFAHASIEPIGINEIILDDATEQLEQRFDWNPQLPIDGKLDLLKGVFNYIHKQYGLPLTGFKLTTSIDTPTNQLPTTSKREYYRLDKMEAREHGNKSTIGRRKAKKNKKNI